MAGTGGTTGPAITKGVGSSVLFEIKSGQELRQPSSPAAFGRILQRPYSPVNRHKNFQKSTPQPGESPIAPTR